MTTERPARKQVARPVAAEEPVDKANYNIWHHRPNSRGKLAPKKAAAHRCRPARDSGKTRGSESGASFCCIDFARGVCAAGAQCNYLHRVPTAQDEARAATDLSVDVFGRGKVAEARDNRLGAGSFERDCRTLYVNYSGAVSHMQTGLQAKQLLEPECAEFGALERMHMVGDKRLAFVTYTQRSSAEFAKEAMAQQRVPGGDMDGFLDVRWANEDPNPRAQARVKREHASAFSQAVARSVDELPEAAKRARLMELHIQASARPNCASVLYYPDTSAQYACQLPAGAGGGAADHALDQRDGDAAHAAACEADALYGAHTGIHPYGWPGHWAHAQGYAMHSYSHAYPAGMCEPPPASWGAAGGPVQGSEGGSKTTAPGDEAQHEAQRSSGGGAAAAKYGGSGSEPTQAGADGLGLLAGYESGSEGSE